MDFLTTDRMKQVEEPPKQRIDHDREFVAIPSSDVAAREARRCMNCGTPFCRSKCPLGNDIPRFNRLVANDRWDDAYEVLRRTNPFPEFTGRVCPAPCESACTLGLVRDPVSIESMEKVIAERASASGLLKPRVPPARRSTRVAVIGSGPAGLSAAYWLNQWGHQVDVYERAERAGGLLMNGIPSFKLSKQLVTRRIDILQQEGVRFFCGVNVGADISAEELRGEYSAVLMACGAAEARRPAWLSGNVENVLMADDFLREFIHRDEASFISPAKGRRVVVLGGGDTGADCVGTSLRQGAASVTQLDIRDAYPEFAEFPRLKDAASSNSWPDAARNHRSSSSHEEGGIRVWSHEVLSMQVDSLATGRDRVISLDVRHLKTGISEKLPCDLLLIAIGYAGAEASGAVQQLNLELDEKLRVRTTSYRSGASGVYAAGDMRVGASLVVTALAEGRKAAEIMHADLCR